MVVPRLLLACVPIVSLGILAWVPSLRMALQGRRNRDWVVLCVWVTTTLTYIVVLAESPDEAVDGPFAYWFAVLFMLAHMGGAALHAILGDMAVQKHRRHRDTPPAGYPGPIGHHFHTGPAYGYPGPGTPGVSGPVGVSGTRAPQPGPTGPLGGPAPFHTSTPVPSSPPPSTPVRMSAPSPAPTPSGRPPASVPGHAAPPTVPVPHRAPGPAPAAPPGGAVPLGKSASGPVPAEPSLPSDAPTPASHRMRQVASELDELDDWLRGGDQR
ncbi:hypothetical protein LZF96_15005 [Streptomyces sp. ST2-7A]|nr:hypothetical protein [Streptomyces sp. ST2-7A]MCE7081407.1 hypothetical protein [Streptomyces sp. ST2-7A]